MIKIKKKNKLDYKQYMAHPIRPYTELTDSMIVQMINEWNYGPAQIAAVLYRDKDDVARHVQELYRTGEFDRIHQKLMDCDSLYARKMERQKREEGVKAI